MSNYRVDRTTSGYQVFETKSEQSIHACTSFVEANKFAQHLELGGGFNGYTPNFFVANTSPEAAEEMRNLKNTVDLEAVL
jgi:hypothetical protein